MAPASTPKLAKLRILRNETCMANGRATAALVAMAPAAAGAGRTRSAPVPGVPLCSQAVLGAEPQPPEPCFERPQGAQHEREEQLVVDVGLVPASFEDPPAHDPRANQLRIDVQRAGVHGPHRE